MSAAFPKWLTDLTRTPLAAISGSTAPKQRLRDIIRAADAARDQRNYEQAISLYRKALQLNPKHPGVWVQLGNMHKDAGHFADSEVSYRQALLLRPRHTDTFLQLGHLMHRSGRSGRAVEYYEKALEIDGTSQHAFQALAAIKPSSATLHASPGPLSVGERIEIDHLIGALRAKGSQGYELFQHAAFR